jgi:hypothetical protein
VVDIETFDLEEVFVEQGAPSVMRSAATATPAVGTPQIRSAAAGG